MIQDLLQSERQNDDVEAVLIEVLCFGLSEYQRYPQSQY